MATIRKREGARGVRWQAIVRRVGYPDSRETFDTKREAEEWASDLERDIRDRKVDPHRLAQRYRLFDATKEYLDNEIKGTKNEKDTRRLLAWWDKKLGSTLLSDLTAPAIAGALNSLSCSGATKNRYLGALSGCLTFISMADYAWIQENPCKRVKRKKEGKRRERILTRAEWITLMEHVDALAEKASEDDIRLRQLPTFLRLAYATGRRRGELLKLRWNDVDLDEGLLYLMDTKTGDDQVVPISEEVVDVLRSHEEQFKTHGFHYVFRGRFHNKPTSFDQPIREIFRELFPPDRKGEVPVLHSIRHTVATELGERGATEAEIKAVTGHHSSVSVSRYVKKTVETARAAQAKRQIDRL